MGVVVEIVKLTTTPKQKKNPYKFMPQGQCKQSTTRTISLKLHLKLHSKLKITLSLFNNLRAFFN